MFTPMPSLNAGPSNGMPIDNTLGDLRADGGSRAEVANQIAVSGTESEHFEAELAKAQQDSASPSAGSCLSCRDLAVGNGAQPQDEDELANSAAASLIASLLSLPVSAEPLPSVQAASDNMPSQEMRQDSGTVLSAASSQWTWLNGSSTMPTGTAQTPGESQATLAANQLDQTPRSVDSADITADGVTVGRPSVATENAKQAAHSPSATFSVIAGQGMEQQIVPMDGRGFTNATMSNGSEQREFEPTALTGADGEPSGPSVPSPAVSATESLPDGVNGERQPFGGFDGRPQIGDESPSQGGKLRSDHDQLGHEDAAFRVLSGEADRRDGGSVTETSRPTIGSLGDVDLARQLLDRIHMVSQRAGQIPARIELELDPPELGRLSVELTDSDRGIIARIVTSRETTASLVDAQLAHLRQSLQDAGVNVRDFHISTDLGQSHSQSFGRQADEETRRSEKARRTDSVSGNGRAAIRSVNRLAAGRVDIRL